MATNLEPEGGERRVYTDPRMRGVEIHNDGGPTFVVIDTKTGAEIDTFTARENVHADEVSEQFAQRRAKEYFSRMVSSSGLDAGGEPEEAVEPELVEPTAPVEPFNRLNWQPKPQPKGLEHPVKGKLGPIRGMNRIMTGQDIDDMIARIRKERNPKRADALKKQALSMMAQEESLAMRIVRHLLEY